MILMRLKSGLFFSFCFGIILGSPIGEDATSGYPTVYFEEETDFTTTISTRVRREAVIDIVTESITEVETLNDGLEAAISSGDKRSENDDSTEDFKYPTTPYPDQSLEGSTIFPDIESNIVKEVTEQSVIVGNSSCRCGTSIKKIVGGDTVPIADLPWTVALVRKSNKTKRGPYCGGTLISNKYVATASHCVDGFEAEKIQVWVNEEDFRVEDENLSGTIRVDVEEIIMHPAYDRRRIDNDIALLRLAEPVDINKISPACLPADNSKTFDGEEAIVAGWGATEQGGSVSATLQKVSVPIISNKACNWRTLYLGRITENQLCAGDVTSGGKDSCQGDSGGPLVVAQADQKILVGVVSYGFGCAKPLAPGVYTRVSKYPEWILENTKDAEYCAP